VQGWIRRHPAANIAVFSNPSDLRAVEYLCNFS
jgi:hypothetical protein